MAQTNVYSDSCVNVADPEKTPPCRTHTQARSGNDARRPKVGRRVLLTNESLAELCETEWFDCADETNTPLGTRMIHVPDDNRRVLLWSAHSVTR